MEISSWIIYVSALVLSLFAGRAAAQDEICACSPSAFTFTLDFSLTCPPVSVTRNPGITATYCQILPFGDVNETVTDLVPVEIDSIDVLELGQTFSVLSQQNISGTFLDGDTFDYTSLIAAEGYDGELPKVLQLNFFGSNALGEKIINYFAISFSNVCDTYPAMFEGDSAGWTSFTVLDAPSVDLCPAVPVDSPTEPPVEPTDAPVDPTDAPVEPTEAPTPFMSMDMSIGDVMTSVEDLLMSMDMSMPMQATTRSAAFGSYFRMAPASTKSSKSMSSKSEKSGKSSKRKRRRLRIRPVYQAD